ncbi:MAG: glycosyltransferase family 4 protein [Spirochaetia bacterium]|nr:glycosyltransferase family 4 protein [Spirochaetia bacterium]
MQVWFIHHYASLPTHSGFLRPYYFAKYLKEYGIQCTIFASSFLHFSNRNLIKQEDKNCYDELYEGIKFKYVKSSNYRGNSISRLINIFTFTLNVIRIGKKQIEKPDVIISSSPHILSLFAGFILAKYYKCKNFIEIRDLWPQSFIPNLFSERSLIAKVLYIVESFFMVNADKIIFTQEGGSEYVKKYKKKLIIKGKINLKNIYYINNGIDFNVFLKNKNNYYYHDSEYNKCEYFKVVYMGSIRFDNDVLKIVECAKLLLVDYPKIKIFIFGDGNYLNEIHKYCEIYKLDNVYLRGRVKREYVPSILANSNLVLLNYRKMSIWKYGSSQNKLFEYLASGKPILCNVKLGYSILKKYNCGIDSDIIAPSDYKDYIIKFYNMDNYDYNKICLNSLETAKKFDYSILTKKLNELLIDCI